MANTIDTSVIDGFDAMTAEQKVEALLGLEIPDQIDLEQYVPKDIYNKKSTEAANLSKQLKSKTEEAKALMSEEQQKQAALAEAAEADQREKEELRNRIAELEKNNTLREYTMSFTSLGLEEKLAAETATAFVDGDSTKVFANLKKFLEAYKKSIEAELMSKTPAPNGAGGASGANGKDAAVAKARELAGTKAGTSKSYNDIMGNYMKR